MLTLALSGTPVEAEPVNGNIPGASDTNGCGPSGNQPQKCGSVPEPSSLILLGVAVGGLAIWRWRSSAA